MTSPLLTRCQPNGPDCPLGQELRDKWYETLDHPDAGIYGTWAYSCRRSSERLYRKHVAACREGENE